MRREGDELRRTLLTEGVVAVTLRIGTRRVGERVDAASVIDVHVLRRILGDVSAWMRPRDDGHRSLRRGDQVLVFDGVRRWTALREPG